MKREFSVVYTPIEDGWIMATAPDVPGAVTQGRDMDEARMMIKEAVELVLQANRDLPNNEATTDSVWETVTVDVPV